MIFKFKYERRGGHYHVSLFSAQSKDYTFAKLGNLILDENDFFALANDTYELVFEKVDE